jgi:hypothetical protein
VTLTPRDVARNTASIVREVDVHSARVADPKPAVFFPQDGDRLATKSIASFKLLTPHR